MVGAEVGEVGGVGEAACNCSSRSRLICKDSNGSINSSSKCDSSSTSSSSDTDSSSNINSRMIVATTAAAA